VKAPSPTTAPTCSLRLWQDHFQLGRALLKQGGAADRHGKASDGGGRHTKIRLLPRRPPARVSPGTDTFLTHPRLVKKVSAGHPPGVCPALAKLL